MGIGHNHGHEKMLALRKLPELFDVVGVVEPDPAWREKRGDMQGYRGLPFLTEEELFAMPDLEAVAIETDGRELLPTALRCAERGLHLHMDKPGGQDSQGFRRLVELCKSRSLALQLAYIYRYNPAIRFCLDAVKNRWIGDVFEVHAVMSRYDGDSPDYRKWLAQFQGGAMYVFAGYLLDLVISMLGRPQKVHSFPKRTRHDGLVDNGLAVLEYDIATATIRVSVEEVDGMKHRRLIICGTEGTLELCPIEVPAKEYYTKSSTVRLTLKRPRGNYEAGTQFVDCGCLGDRYAGQLTEFAKVVRGEMENPFGYEHELLVQETLLEVSGCRPSN
jgi:predicted dehydrogenase